MNEIIAAVVAHANEVAPCEACGLVVFRDGALDYVRCKNVAKDNLNNFTIAPEEYASIEDEGDVVMIAHSHVFIPATPSDVDKVGCEQSGLPWLIVNHPTGAHTITYPTGYKAPLIGRVFSEGLLDCYALVKDYYQQERGITLPDCERPAVWFEIGVSILTDNFKDFGFVEIQQDEMAPGDCILMRVGATVPNHCAVYVGDNVILHHVKDRLSGREVYGSFWRRATTHYLRYAA